MLFTPFDIDFRSIAWFSVALAMTFIVLQLLLLRGESDVRSAMSNVQAEIGKEKDYIWM